MITPAYSPTATERVLPRLALDFTTAALDPRVTVTRALNIGTRVNSNGYIESVNADLPRFDYDPITKVCKGLLIEESRRNFLIYSSDFTQASFWSLDAGCTITTNATTAPDGTTAAQAIVPSANGGTRAVSQQFALFQNGRTFSFFVKAGEINLLTGQNGAGQTWDLNATTGVFSNVDAAFSNPTSVNFGNGWWRCSLTCSAMAGTDFFIGSSAGANSANKFYLWGAQLEVGAFATSYIPTTTTSLTRNADGVAMTGTNFSSWWQATTGAMTVRARQLSATSTRPWTYISDGTANNIISLRGNVTDPELYIKATTDQVQIDAGTLAANTSYGFSGAWNTNDCAAAFNGGSAGTDASATIPTVDRMLIGSDGTNYLSGWAEKISYWPQRITNAETQAFSK